MSKRDIEPNFSLSIRKQCELIGISHSQYYYQSRRKQKREIELKEDILSIYSQYPFYGSRRIRIELLNRGYKINRKTVQRLMKVLHLSTIYPKKKTSIPLKEHKKYPYLLRDVSIESVNEVHSTDITYIKLPLKFAYLTAIMDWRSRFILSWRLSKTMKKKFCIEALEESLSIAVPHYFNMDQGRQFTSSDFLQPLKDSGVKISMDSKGRCFDNIYIERFWRSLKYENIYINDYQNYEELEQGISSYIQFYNYERPHQSLDYKTPYEVYQEGIKNNKFDKVS